MSVILYAFMLSGMITLVSPDPSTGINTGINELKVGSEVPEFILPDQNGKMFDLRRVLGKENCNLFLCQGRNAGMYKRSLYFSG